MSTAPDDSLSLTRRAFLQTSFALAGTVATGALSGCARQSASQASQKPDSPLPDLRPQETGPVREFRRVAEIGDVEVAPGRIYRTWLYDGRFPGEEIRVREGERLRVTVENRLPEGTTVHWHGIPLPNAMDGVPKVTQAPIAPGETFVYDFAAGPSGSYIYHSHMGLQADRGLIGPLVVEEATPHVAWDREYVLVLDDFLPGPPSPLNSGRPGGMGMRMGMMGGETPPYAGLLVNGRLPSAAPIFDVRRGDRARLRLINASGATTFRVAIGGHRMTVSHADGRPIEPVTVDSLIMGTGERYDIIVEANNPGAWALVAAPLELRVEPARAILRYNEVAALSPPAGQVPEGLRGGRILDLADIVSLELGDFSYAAAAFDRTFDLLLSAGMMSPDWTINGQAYPNADPLLIRRGERIRIRMSNQSMMLHPMHLHGHFFRVGRALKDTVIVPPQMGRIDFDFMADNPGDWFFHCHNLYHMESGMARLIRYA